MSNASDTPRVCGVDGCRDGWVVASPFALRVIDKLDQLLDDFDIIGIDMPIGLSADGSRSCDTAARKALPGRASTVFSAPPRALLGFHNYETANAESKHRFGRGISRQAFAIWPKIRELDVLVQREPSRFIEIHPECSFTRMTGTVPPTKHAEPGRNFRAEAIKNVFGDVPQQIRGAKQDDVLDAYAVLWSALRYASSTHEVLGDAQLDDRGLPMRIVV